MKKRGEKSTVVKKGEDFYLQVFNFAFFLQSRKT